MQHTDIGPQSPAAFGIPDDQSPAIHIIGSEIQHFANSHAPAGHQFQEQPITCFSGSEDNLINSLFFNDIPVHGSGWTEKFLQHRFIARILKMWIESFADEVEKTSEM